jgi:hypothetical protein
LTDASVVKQVASVAAAEVWVMRVKILAVGVAVCLASTISQAQQQLQVFGSIVDGTGAAPAALEPGDVRVIEGGVELKTVKVEAVTGWPTKLQLLIDNGIGLGSENLSHVRNGLKGLIEALPAGVELAVYTTAPQPRSLVRPTTDKAAMLKGVDLLVTDSGAGRFIESLNEALQRIERDKTNYFPVIVTVGTAAGDRNVMDRDVERIQKRILDKPTTVHVAILSLTGRSASQGAIQGEIGIWATQTTRGRFETIAAPVRLATLMPEFGAQVAASHQKQATQFRVTVERPNPAAPVGGVSMGTRAGLKVVGLSFDGLHP